MRDALAQQLEQQLCGKQGGGQGKAPLGNAAETGALEGAEAEEAGEGLSTAVYGGWGPVGLGEAAAAVGAVTIPDETWLDGALVEAASHGGWPRCTGPVAGHAAEGAALWGTLGQIAPDGS